MKNYKMANKGMGFEEEVRRANIIYKNRGIALIQKISTPWQVVRKGKQIVSAYPEGKSTLDFRGTVAPGLSISFDCKETQDERGLPLANIADHQIEYMRNALDVGEVTFILSYQISINKRFLIPGKTVIKYWDRWQENKGKKGYNFIPLSEMIEVKSSKGILLDYLRPILEEATRRLCNGIREEIQVQDST